MAVVLDVVFFLSHGELSAGVRMQIEHAQFMETKLGMVGDACNNSVTTVNVCLTNFHKIAADRRSPVRHWFENTFEMWLNKAGNAALFYFLLEELCENIFKTQEKVVELSFFPSKKQDHYIL